MGKRGWIKSEDEIRDFVKGNDEISNKGAYLNLMKQLNRIARHSKGVSVMKTMPQYYHLMDLFCRYVANDYNLKNLSNIQNKHIVGYVVERQSEGKSTSTVKNDLAAIRYFHNQLPNPRYKISDNKTLSENYPEFSLEKRSFGGVNRRPTNLEYQALLNIAHESQTSAEIASVIILARKAGLRIHEAIRLDRADAEKALKDGVLTVKGKGGLIRDVPVQEQVRIVLEDLIKKVKRGHKLFVPTNQKAHQVIQRVQDFVRNNRHRVFDPLHSRPHGVEITMHSFRHAYAKEQYDHLISIGLSEEEARYKVSKLIGHSRQDVTRIYLPD